MRKKDQPLERLAAPCYLLYRMKRVVFMTSIALLFTSPTLRAENTLDKGLWWLYHAQYDKARESIGEHINEHPEDPAGYFYLTAVDWWHLAQEAEYDFPEMQARLKENAHKTMALAEKIYDSTEDKKVKASACLYWGG